MPYLGLKMDSLDSSTRRRTTSFMSKGFLMSGLTRERTSSMGYRGGKGSLRRSGPGRGLRVLAHSRAFWIASNLQVSVSLAQKALRERHLLVSCYLVSKASECGMHVCTTQLFGIDHFSGGHLHQWRASEKGLSLVLYKNGIIGQRRMVRSSSCRGPEYNST